MTSQELEIKEAKEEEIQEEADTIKISESTGFIVSPDKSKDTVVTKHATPQTEEPLEHEVTETREEIHEDTETSEEIHEDTSVQASIEPSETVSISNLEIFIEPEQESSQTTFQIDEASIVTVEVPKKRKKKKQTPSEDHSSISTLEILAEKGSIVGDFRAMEKKASLDSLTTVESIEEEEEWEEEVEDEEIVEQIPALTEEERNEYYTLHDSLEKQLHEEKLKNLLLVRKLVAYYQKKNMFHVLQGDNGVTDMVRRYEKQLDAFDAFIESATKEITMMDLELNELRESWAIKQKEVDLCFEKLQGAELEVGKEIISCESVKNFDTKDISRLLQRQKIQLDNLSTIRLQKIQMSNNVSEVESALSAIDNLGSHLRLLDYEQLRHDNRNLRDKLEDRELELTKVRVKCQNCVQVLAHQREKTDALTAEICNLDERLNGVTAEYEDVREQLNDLKHEKDYYRSAIDRMIANAGLLCKPMLLMDLSDAIKESDFLSRKLEELKKECLELSGKIHKLKCNMGSESKLSFIKNTMNKQMKFEEKKIGKNRTSFK